MYRRIALVAGIAAFGISIISIVAPGVIGIRVDRILVAMVGVLAILLGLRVIQHRRHKSLDEARTPDPEVPKTTPTPGDDFDDVIGEFIDSKRIQPTRTRIREGLREAAVTVLWRYGGYSRAEAESAVEDGTWTADIYAASFLGGPDAPTLPFRDKVTAMLQLETPTGRRIRQTVDEIASVAGLEPVAREAGPVAPDISNAGWLEASRGVSPDGYSERRRDRSEDEGPVESRSTHSTGHWRGVVAVALLGIGVGVLVKQPAVLLAGVIGIGFAGYARSNTFPPGEVSIERSVAADNPEPGESVEVTLKVKNESGRFLPDVRVVDGVPDALGVESGSPRVGTALRAGEEDTATYSVIARRGSHRFRRTTIISRDVSGAIEQRVSRLTETTIRCTPRYQPLVESVPLREHATTYVGQLETQKGGEGIEFFATRDYRPGDAKRHIDWKRHARTGDLTTIMFRQERTATVVLLIDSRTEAFLSPTGEIDHAVDRSVEAAGRLYKTLTRAGNQVGISAIDSKTCWIPPGSGTDHEMRVREALGTNPALSPVRQPGRRVVLRRVDRLRKRLADGTQVLFLSPLCDGYGSHIPRQLDEFGFPVTVVSPNPSADRTPGHRLARVARSLRISALRSTGIPVIDWPWEDSLDEVLARHNEREKT